MKNTERVDQSLFEEQHYLGKPAVIEDKIIGRRLRLMRSVPDFCNPRLDCVEIGCGNGASTVQMSADFHEIRGLEYYADHRKAFESYKYELNAENCYFEQFNIENGPHIHQFDRLVSFEVIEHLEKEESVSNFVLCLKPGGMAVISVPNKWWIFEQHGAQLPLLPWNRVPFFSWLPRPLHERWALARIYTKKRIRKLLEKSGFEVLDAQYITAPMDVLPEGLLKRLVTKYIFKNDSTSLSILSTSIFIVARKL